MHNGLDKLLLLEVADGNAGERAVDLETLDEDALADELEGGDFLQDTVVGVLVEDDGVLGLVLDLSLGPLLLLCGLATAARCRCCFCFGLENQICMSPPDPEVHPSLPKRIHLDFRHLLR